MKKKILLLLLLLVPFMVKADTPADLVRLWEFKERQLLDGLYNAQNTYIKYNHNSIISIDKLTGKRNRIDFPNNSTSKFYQLFINNKILIIMENNGRVISRLYDEYLNEIKTTTIGDFSLEDGKWFNNNYLIITGQKYVNEEYYRVIYFLDTEGNVYKEDSIKTINSTIMYGTSTSNDSRKIFFADDNNNNYYIENYKLVPENTNADGSYMILQNTKLMKYSKNGEYLNKLDIPDGKGTRIAKKGDYYYISTGVYNKVENNNDFKLYITVKLYKVDEGLNIIKTVDVEQEPDAWIRVNNDTGFNRTYHNINNYEGTIYYDIFKISDAYSHYCYTLDEELNSTPTSSCHSIYGKEWSYWLLTRDQDLINNYYEELYGGYLNDPTVTSILNKRGLTPDNGGVTYRKDGSNIIALIRSYRVEGTDDDAKSFSKLDLVYYDKDLNEIFSKTIYDWVHIRTGDYCGSQEVVSIQGLFQDDYIVVAANNTKNNYLQIFDKQGNIVRDFSSDFSDPSLSLRNLIVMSNGIYVEFGRAHIQCTLGVSQTVNNTLVAGANETYQTHAAYYAYPFKVKTQVQGEGTITSKVVKAIEGDLIEFTVEPKPGYVLGAITVTDANGNVLVFTDYKFTMPYADVTIEATFVPINPKTQAGKRVIYSIIICGISILLLFKYIDSKKEIEEV